MVEENGLRFEVLESTDRRVERLRISAMPKAASRRVGELAVRVRVPSEYSSTESSTEYVPRIDLVVKPITRLQTCLKLET